MLRRSAWSWRWGLNFRRALLYQALDAKDSSDDLRELQETGIIIRSSDEFLDAECRGHLAAIEAELPDHETVQGMQREILESESPEQQRFKRFIRFEDVRADCPPLQIAISPRLLSLANGYLGMRSLLRVAQVWLDFPSNAPPTDTQLWHRDEDDYSTLKVFVYLTDVGESNGPFCFVPRSHPRDRDLAELTGYRDQDEQMAACVPRAEWLTCTGNAGTIIIADTRGYHRGLQPRTGHRALLTLQYTSGRPTYPPRVRVRGSHPTSLSPAQYAALHP